MTTPEILEKLKDLISQQYSLDGGLSDSEGREIWIWLCQAQGTLEKYADHDNWSDEEGHTGDINKSVVWCGDWNGDDMQPGYEPAEKLLSNEVEKQA